MKAFILIAILFVVGVFLLNYSLEESDRQYCQRNCPKSEPDPLSDSPLAIACKASCKYDNDNDNNWNNRGI